MLKEFLKRNESAADLTPKFEAVTPGARSSLPSIEGSLPEGPSNTSDSKEVIIGEEAEISINECDEEGEVSNSISSSALQSKTDTATNIQCSSPEVQENANKTLDSSQQNIGGDVDGSARKGSIRGKLSLKKVSRNIAMLAKTTEKAYDDSKKRRHEKDLVNQKKESKSLVERFNLSYFKVRHAVTLKEHTLQSLQVLPALRTEEDNEHLFSLVTGLKSFQKYQTSVQKELCKVVTYEKFGMARTVIRQGDPANSFYYILKGSVDVLKESPNTMGGVYVHNVNELHAGDCFGELALIRKTTRAATIVTREPTEFLKLEKHDFKRIVRKRMKQDIKDRHKFLKEVHILESLSKREMRGLAEVCLPMEFKDGEIIYKTGVKAGHVYFLKSGMVKLMKEVDITKKVVVPEVDKLMSNKKVQRRRDMDTVSLTLSLAEEDDEVPEFHGDALPLIEEDENQQYTSQVRRGSHTRTSITTPTVVTARAKRRSVIACLKILSRGDFFGEKALQSALRTHSAVAYGKVEVIAVSLMEFTRRMPDKIIDVFLHLVRKEKTDEELRELVKERSDWDLFVETTLEDVMKQKELMRNLTGDFRNNENCGMPVFTADEILKQRKRKQQHHNIFLKYSRIQSSAFVGYYDDHKTKEHRPKTQGKLPSGYADMEKIKNEFLSTRQRPQTVPCAIVGPMDTNYSQVAGPNRNIKGTGKSRIGMDSKTATSKASSVSKTPRPTWNSNRSKTQEPFVPLFICKPVVKRDPVLFEIVNDKRTGSSIPFIPVSGKYKCELFGSCSSHFETYFVKL